MIKTNTQMTAKPQYTDPLLNEYVQSMNEKEYQGYLIAKSHLGSSFDLSKSLGYQEYLSKKICK